MMAFKGFRWLVVLAFAALVGFGIQDANAAVILTLNDGNPLDTINVSDGGAGDSNPVEGVITYNGAVGSNWWINVSTGITQPAQGTSISPNMDLNSVNLSRGAGTLQITFSDSGYLNPYGGIALSLGIGGTTVGNVTYEAFADATSLGSLFFTTPGPFPIPFSGSTFGSASPGELYTLTQVVTITHSGSGTTSFDATLVPEPGTMLLLGTGLIGLAGWGRKKYSK